MYLLFVVASIVCVINLLGPCFVTWFLVSNHLTEEERAGCFTLIRRGIRFPTRWYVRPAKPQISLRIRAV